MKFSAQEWLDRYDGDPLKALESLHKEVELRETENGKFRDDIRDANREKTELEQKLEALKTQQPKPEDVMTEEVRAELAEYRALGAASAVSQELTHLRESDEAKTMKIFEAAMEKQLLEAGIDSQYIPQAMAVLKADDKYFNADEENDDAEVEFSVDTFKEDNKIFFPEKTGISILGANGKGAGVTDAFKGLADNYVKDKFDVPASP